MSREFLLPDLGSGLKEGEIVLWRVAVGDVVTTDDLLVDIETEKAVIEVPVPYDGTVISLAAAEGESVKVGSVLAVFDTGETSAETADKPATKQKMWPIPHQYPWLKQPSWQMHRCPYQLPLTNVSKPCHRCAGYQLNLMSIFPRLPVVGVTGR